MTTTLSELAKSNSDSVDDALIVITEGLSTDDWFVTSTAPSKELLRTGMEVKPERITTPPPPWAAISVPPAVSVARPVVRVVTHYEIYTGRVDQTVKTTILGPLRGRSKKFISKSAKRSSKGIYSSKSFPTRRRPNWCRSRCNWGRPRSLKAVPRGRKKRRRRVRHLTPPAPNSFVQKSSRRVRAQSRNIIFPARSNLAHH